MTSKKNKLQAVWDQHGSVFSSQSIAFDFTKIDQMAGSLFQVGPTYFYVIDFSDRSIQYVHPAIKNILGIQPSTFTFSDILDHIHPEDMEHVAQMESLVISFYKNHIEPKKFGKYKIGYRARLRIANGTYQLFQHQAFPLTTNGKGQVSLSLNIHTSIEHITPHNNYQATISGILGEKQVWQLNGKPETQPFATKLYSKRELQVICLLAEGLNSAQIGDSLFIAENTVKNHRKNILKKAGVSTTAALITKCIQDGLI